MWNLYNGLEAQILLEFQSMWDWGFHTNQQIVFLINTIYLFSIFKQRIFV